MRPGFAAKRTSPPPERLLHRFAERLLTEERVAVVPGSAFGPSGAGHVRMCYATSYERLEEALRRIDRGHYEARLERVASAGENAGVEDFTRRYVARLESLIRESPEDWAWTHRRWKLQPPAAVSEARAD